MVWDEPDLLHNVKRVNPWLVELVSTMAPGHGHGLGSPFSPPRKRPRLPQPTEFPYGHLQISSLFGNPLSPSSPLCCLQGARHARFELPSSDLELKKLQPFDFKLLDYGYDASLKMGSEAKRGNEAKAPMFLLFGQPILTADQISQSHSLDSSDGNQANVSNGSGSAVIQNFPQEASDGEFPRPETGPCKVFVESENVGRTLDLYRLCSYEELYMKLSAIFGMERSEISSNVLYTDARGNAKHVGDEPLR